MSIESPDFLKHFGEIKFAEENSGKILDFERFINPKEKEEFINIWEGDFIKLNNARLKDFKRSLKKALF
jgi:hypothetical protein